MEQEAVDKIAGDVLSNDEPSQIRDFYKNTTVFITGGFGFLGRLTVEKVLRSCPGVSKLYLLSRPKKGKTAEERLDALFNDVVFEKVRQENPEFHTKVTLVNGDCEKENLGLSEEDRKMLINEVNIVLHLAATVRFDEKMRKAAYINIRAVKDLLIMAKEMQHLKSYIHVSTAYSHCTKEEVDEVFYETPISGDNIINLINVVDDEYLETLTPSLLSKWPNTYTFTKAIAELTIREHGKGFPISIVRPSIVVSTLKEPVAGWANNYYGAIGVSCAVGLGLIHTLYCDPSYLADMVPADYTVNAILAASWAVGQAHADVKEEKINNVSFDELSVLDDVPIFNYVCSPEKPITWGRYMDEISVEALKYPSMHCIWYYSLYLCKHLFIYKIYSFFMHLIPAYIADGVLYIIGRKPMVVAIFAKAGKLLDALEYFMKRQWVFKNDNVQALWKKLGKTDQGVFEFSMATVNWQDNYHILIKAARVYLFKDPLETLPQARKFYFKLKVAHYTIVYLFYFGIAYLSWRILSACLF